MPDNKLYRYRSPIHVTPVQEQTLTQLCKLYLFTVEVQQLHDGTWRCSSPELFQYSEQAIEDGWSKPYTVGPTAEETLQHFCVQLSRYPCMTQIPCGRKSWWWHGPKYITHTFNLRTVRVLPE